MSCRDAERLAARSRDARVVYGAQRSVNRRDDDRDRYDNRNSRYSAMSVPYQNGYRDGLDKGREDARDRDSFDPVRHSRYRSADHGYNSRYGRKDDYKLVYREGFEAGYREAYRNDRSDQRYRSRMPYSSKFRVQSSRRRVSPQLERPAASQLWTAL